MNESKAGRELDALIAEKMFGLSLTDRFTGESRPITSGQALQHVELMKRVPHYSTDIAAAWGVVHKITGLGYGFEMRGLRNVAGTGLRGFQVAFRGPAEQEPALATAPLAICLAALKIL